MNTNVNNESTLGMKMCPCYLRQLQQMHHSGGGSYGKSLYFPLSFAMNLNYSKKRVFLKKSFFAAFIPFSTEVALASYAAIFPTGLQTQRTSLYLVFKGSQ